jgi:hypothetical protein
MISYLEETLRILVKHSGYFHGDVRLQAITALKRRWKLLFEFCLFFNIVFICLFYLLLFPAVFFTLLMHGRTLALFLRNCFWLYQHKMHFIIFKIVLSKADPRIPFQYIKPCTRTMS